MYNEIVIWGVKFNLLSLKEFVEAVSDLIVNENHPVHITGINPETVVHSSRSEILRMAILKSDLVNVDNSFIVLTLRILGYKVPERVATPDLFEALLNLANNNKHKIFILGAKEEILQKAVPNILKQYPNIDIKMQNGYYPKEMEQSIIEMISDFSPDMLFIALPSPRKEAFILENKNTLNAKLLLGVGGAIDCKAGLVKRPPHFISNNGFEGIFRSLQSPFNYGKRYLEFYPKFLSIVIKSLIKKNKI
jgi:N-acetylglucosaminyldiphosphoundecaprenol N-acetyl-beta-D-mannosaminyltransferase